MLYLVVIQKHGQFTWTVHGVGFNITMHIFIDQREVSILMKLFNVVFSIIKALSTESLREVSSEGFLFFVFHCSYFVFYILSLLLLFQQQVSRRVQQLEYISTLINVYFHFIVTMRNMVPLNSLAWKMLMLFIQPSVSIEMWPWHFTLVWNLQLIEHTLKGGVDTRRIIKRLTNSITSKAELSRVFGIFHFSLIIQGLT